MTQRTPPTTTSVSSLLGSLFGKTVTVRRGQTKALGVNGRAYVGLYVLDDETPMAAILCDVGAAAAFGCALALIHPNVAADWVKRGKLDEGVFENLKEVLNIMGGLVNQAGLPRLRLGSVVATPPVPAAAAPLLKTPSTRLDLSVQVEGYGPGAVSLFLAEARE